MNIKQALLGALYFGLAMTVVMSFSLGIIGGLIGGVSAGLLFGLGIFLFANSPMVKKQTQVKEEELLPGEQIIAVYGAGMVVRPKEFGLKKFAFGSLLWTVGMKNKESLGGKVTLTNFRLIFKSHKLNRLRGMFSIFLPTIQALRNTSFFITRKVSVETQSSKLDFVIFEVQSFLTDVELEQTQLDQDTIQRIQQLAKEFPHKCCSALSTWNSLNTINNLLLIGQKGEKAVKLVTNPVGALGAIFMKELLDTTIAEEWQKNFE